MHVPMDELQGHSFKAVNLANNKILKIETISHAESEEIEELSLASNRLVKIEGLSRLTNLRILKLARNSISKLENLDSLVHLRYCDLSHNNIKAIDNLQNNKELEFLDLSYNGIRSLTASTTTPPPLSSLSSLRTLLLGHNMLKSIEDAPSHLPPSLTSLGLDYNDIQGVNNLSILTSFANLSEISLRGNPLIPSLASHVDSVPLVARLLPNVKSVDGKEITSKQRETALALFGEENFADLTAPSSPSLSSSSPSTRLGRLLDPSREHDLALYLSKRGKTSPNSPSISSPKLTAATTSSTNLNVPGITTNANNSSSSSPKNPPTSPTSISNSSPSTNPPNATSTSASKLSKTSTSSTKTNPSSTTNSTITSTPNSSPNSTYSSSNSTSNSTNSSTNPSSLSTSPNPTVKTSRSANNPSFNPSTEPSSTSSKPTDPKAIKITSDTSTKLSSTSTTSLPSNSLSTSSNTPTDPSVNSTTQPTTKTTKTKSTKPTNSNGTKSTDISSPPVTARPRTPPPHLLLATPPGSPNQAYPYPFSPFPPPKSPRAATYPISESSVYLNVNSPSPSSSPSSPSHSSISNSYSPPPSPSRHSRETIPRKLFETTTRPTLSPPVTPPSIPLADAQIAALLARMGNVEARCLVQESALRELWAEVQYLRSVQVRHEHKAATIIQRFWRGYYTRKLYNVIRRDFRNHIQTISTFATVIQRHWRGHTARKHVAALRARTYAATQVQAAARGWLARRAYSRKLRKLDAANARIAQVEADFTALRTQMSNLNKYVLALAALVKQSAHFPVPPAPK